MDHGDLSMVHNDNRFDANSPLNVVQLVFCLPWFFLFVLMYHMKDNRLDFL